MVFLSLLLGWGALGAGTSLAAPPSAGQAPPPMVLVQAIAEREVNPPREFVGRVEAVQSVQLRARVQGFVEEVRFQEGGAVKDGDLLYVLEKAPYAAQVAVDRAKVAKAKADLSKADQYLGRVKSVATGGVSKSDLEVAQADQQAAQAQLQEAQATLAQSELNLAYTEIKAPIGGRIGATAFTKGDLVGPESGAMATIVQQDPIRVLFSFSETLLPEAQKILGPHLSKAAGSVLTLVLPDGSRYEQQGRPEFLDNQVDAHTGTIAVRALFSNPDGFLVPGQYVKVQATNSEAKKMPVVPQAAVMTDKEGRYVFVVGPDQKAQARRITTGDVVDSFWVVNSGLTAGEMVIVQGVQKVRPGQPVQPQVAK